MSYYQLLTFFRKSLCWHFPHKLFDCGAVEDAVAISMLFSSKHQKFFIKTLKFKNLIKFSRQY